MENTTTTVLNVSDANTADGDLINSDPTETEPKEETVPAKEFNKVLNEMHTYKKTARDATDKLNDMDIQRKKENEDWKGVAEVKEKEAFDATTKYNNLQTSFQDNVKYSAVKQEALKMGILPEALSDLELQDLDGVQIETTSTGKVTVLGAKKMAEKLKSMKPHWFAKQRKTNINNGNPEVVEGTGISYDMLEKARKKAEESGDYAPYEKLNNQFMAQPRV